MTGRWYLVESPVYTYIEPVLDFGEGPAYDVRDTLFVRSRSARRASVLALRTWRRQYRYHPLRRPTYLFDNPFTGMKVSLAIVENGVND
jgi:hypothetical protein